MPNDILCRLTHAVHDDDKHSYVLSLEREVARLRQGLLTPALRGRIAYELRVKSRDNLDMPTARAIVDSALEDALKGSP